MAQSTPQIASLSGSKSTFKVVDSLGKESTQSIDFLNRAQFDGIMQQVQASILSVSGQGGAGSQIHGDMNLNGHTISDVVNSSPPAATEALSYQTAQQLYGVVRGAVTQVNANYTVKYTDGTILVNGSNTVTLPDIGTAANNIYIIVQWTAGTTTLRGNSNQLINGQPTQSLTNQYSAMVVQAAGKSWAIVSNVGVTTAGGGGVTSLNGLNGILTIDAGAGVSVAASGSDITISATTHGTVDSVAMTGDGTVFNASVPGSPVTTTGTLAPTLKTQNANTALLGPTSGSAAAPTFRALAVADIPSLALASINLTGQSAAISSTLLYAVPAAQAGLYQISFTAKITTAASVSSKLGGTNSFQVVYTDADDSVVVTSPAGLFYNSSSATLTLNTTQAIENGVVVVNAAASSNINYSFDYTSVGTAMVFSLHVKVVKL